jgi:hypothetical protein
VSRYFPPVPQKEAQYGALLRYRPKFVSGIATTPLTCHKNRARNTAIRASGLTPGAHFFTVKAVDSSGKRSFAHVVVDAP